MWTGGGGEGTAGGLRFISWGRGAMREGWERGEAAREDMVPPPEDPSSPPPPPLDVALEEADRLLFRDELVWLGLLRILLPRLPWPV